jgi:hypothetical protein
VISYNVDAMTTLRAQFDGKVLVPVEPVDLQPGHLYELEVREPNPPRRSPQEILRSLDALPEVSLEDVQAMEAEIKRGEKSIQFEDPFARGGGG